MKKNLVRSFRIEIVLYSILSIIFTIISEITLFGGIYLIVKLVNPNLFDQMKTSFTSYKSKGENPIYFGDKGLGSYGTYRYNQDVRISFRFNLEIFMTILALAIILGIMLFIFFFLSLTKKFTNYLNVITDGIRKISSGDFKHRIAIESKDEFGIIASNLNWMVSRLEENIEENEKNEKNKNALITSMAHDLRTPLTSMIGYLDLANNPELSEGTKEHYMNVAYSKSRNIEKLIEDLFDYTRVSFREMNLNITTINMVQFVNQLADEFYPSFREKDLDYNVKIEGAPISVEGDGDLLARAITNLIGNAIKYGKDGKKVDINLKKEKDKVVLQVINYGHLIPEEDIPHIFERFYRVEESRSSDTGGTGLGLAIAKEIIELHEGKISAKSDFYGTVFQVELKRKGGGVDE